MEKRITKKVLIKDIVFEEELYPRSSYSWQTGYDYAQSMLSGAKFPLVTLAVYNKKLYLVDGKHRIEAYKQLKQKEVDAEIFIGWSKEKIFIEAVKRNIIHGRMLSPFEKRRIALKLRMMKLPEERIGELIQVPIGKLQNFIAQRMTNAITGETIVKSEVSHLAGINYEGDIEKNQKQMYSKSQSSLLREVIRLFQFNLIDKKDKEIKELIKVLKKLL